MTKQFAVWGFRHAAKTLLGRDDFVSFYHMAAICDLSSYVKYKRPNITPDDLDVLAPGWRAPGRVEQDGTFEIVPQTSEGYWRLGNDLGVPFDSASSDGFDEPLPGEKTNSESAGNRTQAETIRIHASNKAPTPGPIDLQRDARSRGMRRSIRKLTTVWRRPKASPSQDRVVTGD